MINMLFFAMFFLTSLAFPQNDVSKKIDRKKNSFTDEISVSSAALVEIIKQKCEKQPGIRGIHLTSWGAGSKKFRRQILEKVRDSVINTVVVAIKETDGKVYISGVENAHKYGSYVPAISNPEEMIEDFKKAGLYKIARIVVFKDNYLTRQRQDLAVKTPEGKIWKSFNGSTWVDPYNKEIWDYNMEIAIKCAMLGFDEIQFDYIRFPSEGKISMCRYSKPHTDQSAINNLKEFLKYVREKLQPHNVQISAAIFGLTTTIAHDMGIGQNIETLAQYSDYIYPMMYPSHYEKGNYGLKNPNASPFKVINYGMRDARARLLENYCKIRPYLQDFSLGHRYGPNEVRAQIIAARRNFIKSWILWNPGNRYTWSALTPHSYKMFIEP
jgi:hypothetical protein